jgi:hypothetical protein
MTQRYAAITTVSSFRIRYVIPIQEGECVHSLQDLVTCGDIDEFSQRHLDETTVDAVEVSQEQMLDMFDRDNDYLKNWTQEKKIEWVNRTRKG